MAKDPLGPIASSRMDREKGTPLVLNNLKASQAQTDRVLRGCGHPSLGISLPGGFVLFVKDSHAPFLMINHLVKGAAGLGHHFSCYQFFADWKGHQGWGYGRPSKAQVLVLGSGVSWDINEGWKRKVPFFFLKRVNSKCSMVFSSVVGFLHTTSALNEQFQFEDRILGWNKFRKQ